jgi:hypothetical protein
MNRILTILASAMLITGLAACGGGAQPDNAVTSSESSLAMGWQQAPVALKSSNAATRAAAQRMMAMAKPLAAAAQHSFMGDSPEAACEAAFEYGEANFAQYMPYPEVTQHTEVFCYRHYAVSGFYVGIVVAPNATFNQFGIYIMGDAGSGFSTTPVQIGWWDELPLQTRADCQLMPTENGIWTTPIQIGANIFGSWSAVTLNDRSTLLLKQEQSVDPNELTVIQFNCRGEQIGSWQVASRPAAAGDLTRPTLYSPVIKTDGSAAWISWRQYEPNGNNSDEVESAYLRRWVPGSGLSAVVSIVPRYGGSITDADIDVAPDGSAIAAWLETVPNAAIPVHFGPRLAAAMTWSPASGWSAPVNLVAPNSMPRQDIDRIAVSTPSLGKAAVIWIRQDSLGQMVEGVQLQATGNWSDPEKIFRDEKLYPSLIGSDQWKVVMDETGSTTALWSWRSWDGKQNGISYNHRLPGENWPEAQSIAPLGTEATMSVSIARNGYGAVAWRAGYDVAAVRFDKAGLIDGAYLTYFEPFMGAALLPKAVVDADGHIVVVWAEVFYNATNGATEVARGARFSPDTGWSRNVTLSTDEAPTRPLGAANSAGGIGSVLWIHGSLGSGPSRAGVWLAPFSMTP